MTVAAAMKQYRKEMIDGFEKRQSLLRHTVTTEFVRQGNQAEFLVVDSGGASATTRGVDGDIVSRDDNNTQTTCTLNEYNDLVRKSKFNIFASQGDQRAVMQRTTMAVINRKCDELIRTALETATVEWNGGTAVAATLALIQTAYTTLCNAFAADGPDEIFAVITPAFRAEMFENEQFTSVDYVNGKPFEGLNRNTAFNWYGINFIVDPEITGTGTNDAQCYMYNKRAIGSAVAVSDMDVGIGYDEEQRRSWARCSIDMGAVKLQNAGIVGMPHDDTAYTI